MSNPTDKARELADRIERDCLMSDYYAYDNSGAAVLIDAALQSARLDAIEAAKAYRELTICYRVGKRPSEKLFARLEKANTLLDAPKEAKNV